jgi:hypothetical protein
MAFEETTKVAFKASRGENGKLGGRHRRGLTLAGFRLFSQGKQ